MPITKATASSIAPAAKGDLVVGSATNDASVLAVGSANQVLTVDSSTSTGLKWAAVAAGGKVLQVVSSTATTFQGIKSASAVDVTNMSISITPSSVSSKVLITGMLNGVDSQTATKQRTVLRLVDGSNISLYCILDDDSPTSSGPRLNIPFTYLHSPASTSALTYKLRVTNDTSAQGIYVNNNFTVNITSSIVAMEIGA